MASNGAYKSLGEFYPFYLTEHQHTVSRVLHFIGTLLVILWVFGCLFLQEFAMLGFVPLIGYSFAWVGHFFFEKNKPATFQYPLYSLASDFILFFDLLRGKQKFNGSR